MVRVWNEDPKKSPNPYEEPVLGKLIFSFVKSMKSNVPFCI